MSTLGRTVLAAMTVVALLAAGQPCHAFLEHFLGEPGSGIHIFPDWRPPHGTQPPPGQGSGGTTPLPPTFGTLIQTYIKFADDVRAMRNWFTTLTPAEKEQYRAQYEATLARLASAEDQVSQSVLGPLEQGNEKPLYALFDMIRKMDPFRARGVFLALLDRVAQRVNMDYISDPQNPIKARRARDVHALRAWIGNAE